MRKLRPGELVCTLKLRRCPGMCSVVKKDLCQLLSSCPVIHVFSQPHARPSMRRSVTLVLGLRKLHFCFAGCSRFGSASKTSPPREGSVPGPPEPLLSEMSAPVGSARLSGLSLNNMGSSPKSLAFPPSSFFLCSLGLPRGSELLPASVTS